MKPPLKTLLTLSLIALMALPMSAIGKNAKLDWYDKVIGTPEEPRWPPWIPGTEGQKEVKVQVLDATTMEPIAGAIVVGAYGGNVCVISESAVSDAQGWATLPNDEDPRIRGDERRLRGPELVSAYKRGYQLARPVRHAVAGGHNEWYVREVKPTPRGSRWEIISAEKFSDNHKATLMETKERSRIYLMPSTATTKEERERELNWVSPRCYKYPFAWSSSEGGLAIEKAIHQELIDIGYYSKQGQERAGEDIERYENNLREMKQEAARGK
jgi:hypothetical protein